MNINISSSRSFATINNENQIWRMKLIIHAKLHMLILSRPCNCPQFLFLKINIENTMLTFQTRVFIIFHKCFLTCFQGLDDFFQLALHVLDVTIANLVSQPQFWARDQGKGLQGCGPKGRPESHFTCSRECKECEGMNLHTHK